MMCVALGELGGLLERENSSARIGRDEEGRRTGGVTFDVGCRAGLLDLLIDCTTSIKLSQKNEKEKTNIHSSFVPLNPLVELLRSPRKVPESPCQLSSIGKDKKTRGTHSKGKLATTFAAAPFA